MLLYVDLPWLVVCDPGPRTQGRRGSGAARGTSALKLGKFGGASNDCRVPASFDRQTTTPSQHEYPTAPLPISWG